MDPIVLAIDVGTSSTRAALIDRDLNVIAIGHENNELLTPRPGYVEQDPESILNSVLVATKRCFADVPESTIPHAVILDTAMHSLVAMGGDGEALSPMLTWGDTRSKAQAGEIASHLDFQTLYEKTGCPPHASYLPAKIRWFKQNQRDVFDQAATLTSIKAYILYHITRSLKVTEDLASASGSGLLNMEALQWDDLALKAAGLNGETPDQDASAPDSIHISTMLDGVNVPKLPRLVRPTDPVGYASQALSACWDRHGDAPEVPVFAGGTDGPLANVGAGAVNPGEMVITVGTSAAIRMITDSPKVDQKGRTWCYYVADDAWAVGGALNAGGASLNWLTDAFPAHFDRATKGDHHQIIDQMVQNTPPGADGLLFAPFFSGERSPGWNENARGFMVGAGMHHKVNHFARAIMEGVAFQIASVVEGVKAVAGDPTEIRITGGFTASSTWPQILADVLGTELLVPENTEGTLIGTALLGHAAIDPEYDWREKAKTIRITGKITPNRENTPVYERYLKTYYNLYDALTPHFDDIAAWYQTD